MIIVTDNGAVVVEPEPPPRPTWPPRPPQLQFGFTWTGSDGQEWDLCGSGPVSILSGARGYGLPTPQHRITQRLGDGGSRQKGRIPPRELFMPVEIQTQDTVPVEGAFFAGINPWDEGVHRVTTPTGTWRELVCHYLEGGEGEYEVDPHLAGRAVYPLRMQATDNPYWQGAPVEFEIEKATGGISPFPGPPFTYAASRGFNSDVVVNNPGDVDSHLFVRVEGPFTKFSIGIGDAVVAMSVAKAAGGWVEVDMRPGRQSYRDNLGANLRPQLTRNRPFPISPGRTRIVTSLADDGPGTRLLASFTPNFYRAWG